MDRRQIGAALPGQVAIIFALALSVLILVAGLAVDVGGALSVKTSQTGQLEAASQSCMARANAVKYSPTPGATARAQALDVLSAARFTGTATVWYAEAPAERTGERDRFGGTLLSIEQPYETSLLTVAGMAEIDVASSLAWTIHPYSSSKVYRPGSIDEGWERVRMSEGEVTAREGGACSLSTCPDPLREAVERAMDAGAGKGQDSKGAQ